MVFQDFGCYWAHQCILSFDESTKLLIWSLLMFLLSLWYTCFAFFILMMASFTYMDNSLDHILRVALNWWLLSTVLQTLGECIRCSRHSQVKFSWLSYADRFFYLFLKIKNSGFLDSQTMLPGCTASHRALWIPPQCCSAPVSGTHDHDDNHTLIAAF